MVPPVAPAAAKDLTGTRPPIIARPRDAYMVENSGGRGRKNKRRMHVWKMVLGGSHGVGSTPCTSCAAFSCTWRVELRGRGSEGAWASLLDEDIIGLLGGKGGTADEGGG